MDLRSKNKAKDMKSIVHTALREMRTLGEFINGAAYRATNFQDHISGDELREWDNMLGHIERILHTAIEVADEREESEEGLG